MATKKKEETTPEVKSGKDALRVAILGTVWGKNPNTLGTRNSYDIEAENYANKILKILTLYGYSVTKGDDKLDEISRLEQELKALTKAA